MSVLDLALLLPKAYSKRRSPRYTTSSLLNIDAAGQSTGPEQHLSRRTEGQPVETGLQRPNKAETERPSSALLLAKFSSDAHLLLTMDERATAKLWLAPLWRLLRVGHLRHTAQSGRVSPFCD
ncbi:unnamed protein product [Protopolystoma xenopodis]|uniref:Uncharacterized protein n=1 Tax=Protopolystoma xenopodis TaxID=117903 RepID=A0A3S5ADU5_9PLAT|nr:unnamed protein product [Protopolystoma xenopodis]